MISRRLKGCTAVQGRYSLELAAAQEFRAEGPRGAPAFQSRENMGEEGPPTDSGLSRLSIREQAVVFFLHDAIAFAGPLF
jgi:hypothetical protein